MSRRNKRARPKDVCRCRAQVGSQRAAWHPHIHILRTQLGAVVSAHGWSLLVELVENVEFKACAWLLVRLVMMCMLALKSLGSISFACVVCFWSGEGLSLLCRENLQYSFMLPSCPVCSVMLPLVPTGGHLNHMFVRAGQAV